MYNYPFEKSSHKLSKKVQKKVKGYMLEKINIKKRNNNLYPYSIVYMGREEVLLNEKELVGLYNSMNRIIVEDNLLVKK